MITLFVDSSSKYLKIALSEDDKLITSKIVNSHSKHSNFLIKEIIEILSEANLTINDIDNFIVLNGPGSFTGLRVGVTVIKTLSWAMKKKAYQLGNLKALSLHDNGEVVISVIYDKDEASYVGIYGDEVKEGYCTVSEVCCNLKNKEIVIVTLEENQYVNNLKAKLLLDNIVRVNIIENYNYLKVINYALSCDSVNPHILEPVYLKKIDAEKNKK